MSSSTANPTAVPAPRPAPATCGGWRWRASSALYGSFPQLGVPVGLIISDLVFLVLTATLSTEQFLSWGWRIPFLVSAVLVAVGLYVRLKVTESPEFTAAAKASTSIRLPIVTVVRDHWPQVLCGIGIFAGITGVWGVPVYLTLMIVLAGIGTVVAARLHSRTAVLRPL
jgi:MFS family permease